MLQKTEIELKTEFEPISSWPTTMFWSEKSKLPNSFNAFLVFTAKFHKNSRAKLKELCKDAMKQGEWFLLVK